VILIGLYLAAVVVANLTVAAFGPSVTVINAFWLIGLDLTVRDKLHDRWQGRGLWLRMAALIGAGGLISYVLNASAVQIAIASTVAFVIAGIADATAYALLHDRPWFQRANGSNIAGAAFDSVLFPTLAFGSLLPLIVLGQFAAKVAGGFLWSVVLALPQWRRAA
jgi:uncharacterized PurR-regulated membrane protein YhhQ (DUF165 family)